MSAYPELIIIIIFVQFVILQRPCISNVPVNCCFPPISGAGLALTAEFVSFFTPKHRTCGLYIDLCSSLIEGLPSTEKSKNNSTSVVLVSSLASLASAFLSNFWAFPKKNWCICYHCCPPAPCSLVYSSLDFVQADWVTAAVTHNYFVICQTDRQALDSSVRVLKLRVTVNTNPKCWYFPRFHFPSPIYKDEWCGIQKAGI